MRAGWTGVLVALSACASDGATLPGADGAPGDPAEHGDAGQPQPAGPDPVRLVVLGDTGEGNAGQYAVASAMAEVCAVEGCDFAILLGDNIYDDGVDSVDDPQWHDKFEAPYADLDLPFYAVLGNHDYGGQLVVDTPGLGNEWWKGPLEVEYSEVSPKWILPATHYAFRVENVGFLMLDTNSLLWDDQTHGDQREWYPAALAQLGNVDWVIAAGHHPYRSNGRHGNAGDYESIEVGGVEVSNPVPILDGGHVADFLEQVVCGTVDLYAAGHDHNRQWLAETMCGAELVVSGAGAKLTALRDRGNRTHFEDDSQEGFLHLTIEGKVLTGRFYGADGSLAFERVLEK